MAEKPQLHKMNTMVVTAKIGKEILGGEKLGDTRQMTSVKKTKRLKKGSTISRTIEEAKVLLGSDVKLADVDAARSLRVRTNRSDKLVTVKKRKAPGGRGTGGKVKKPSGPSGDGAPNAK
ncbi:hypothetical protein X801_04751 [Opisthorchis viverrini]|uniref:Uncharacterized protein n=2 Tax=Opisthorchis viverrini TaxID=6198 RepID=A0A1S8WY96_OPIVI|nr:hypothetical protein T265_00937 [Opisthorchis viverrini]KER33253.1 hypothetical protein T265_00937 [Opisthorchis viverrini]OON19384.1 hypothetical protein X801_04751 [Opisthorchis viverrini]